MTDLRRWVVGTDCWWGQSHCQQAVIGRGEGYAGSAWFQSDHLDKRVSQAEGDWFICGSVYEPGLMSHLPETVWQAVGLGLNW